MSGLVLSLFSGLGALDEGFREAGWCVVSAGDVAWSSLYDIRRFHPPAGVFEGIIGGDPCQSHSPLANLGRSRGREPSFPDMTPEFQRVIEVARPRWFLRENVPKAPNIKAYRYSVRSFLLDNGASLGEKQARVRRFWFGTDKHFHSEASDLRRWIDFSFEPLDHLPSVTGRHHGAIGTTGGHAGNPPRYSLDEMLELQGLPKDVFAHSPLTVQGKRKLCGNAVPLPMARAIAKAVRAATQS